MGIGSDRTAVITGGGSGIGRATTLKLLAEGFTVATIDRDASGLDETHRLAAAAGGQLHLVVGDLASPDTLEAAFGAAAEAIGAPDVLINNAGVGFAGTVTDTTTAGWDQTIAVNLSAAFHLCRLALPGMLERGSGTIVNVSSVAGVVGLRNRAAYCASKAGLIGLTRALAADHASQGLRVNAICPGTVETEWVDRIIAGTEDRAATRAQMAARQLDGRMGTADEVAAGILFLVSPGARFVNGSVFVMDGGLSAV